MTPAQDPEPTAGQDPAPDVGWQACSRQSDGRKKKGAASVPVIEPPADTEAAKTAPVVKTYTFPGPNLTPAETWTSGTPDALWSGLRA